MKKTMTTKPSADTGTADSDLMSMMGMAMLKNGGLDLIKKAATESEDPVQVIGNFMANLVGQVAELGRDSFGIDPGVFIQKDGFLDQTLGYVERQLKLPQEISDQIYAETMEVMKAAAMAPEGQPNAPQGPQGPQGPAPSRGLDGGMM